MFEDDCPRHDVLSGFNDEAAIKLRANLEQEFVSGGYIPEARGSMRCSSAL